MGRDGRAVLAVYKPEGRAERALVVPAAELTKLTNALATEEFFGLPAKIGKDALKFLADDELTAQELAAAEVALGVLLLASRPRPERCF
jgi:hypothetical protein